jgi:hypothetical protein
MGPPASGDGRFASGRSHSESAAAGERGRPLYSREASQNLTGWHLSNLGNCMQQGIPNWQKRTSQARRRVLPLADRV